MNTDKNNSTLSNRILKYINNILGDIYIFRHKKTMKNNADFAYSLLTKGMRKYSNNVKLYRELSKIAIFQNNWNDALTHLEKIFKLSNRPLMEDYFNYSITCRKKGNIEKAYNILQNGYKIYNENESYVYNLIEISIENNDWQSVVLYMDKWETLPNKQSKYFSYNMYVGIYAAYKFEEHYEKAQHTLDIAIRHYPFKRNELLEHQGELLVLKKDWTSAIYHYETHADINDVETQIKISILYKIIGETYKFEEKFRQIIKYNSIKIKKDKFGYRKIILFDNGETRIEFYKSLEVTDSVIVTFDAINMTWVNRRLHSNY